jgi:hypothetical protein
VAGIRVEYVDVFLGGVIHRPHLTLYTYVA